MEVENMYTERCLPIRRLPKAVWVFITCLLLPLGFAAEARGQMTLDGLPLTPIGAANLQRGPNGVTVDSLVSGEGVGIATGLAAGLTVDVDLGGMALGAQLAFESTGASGSSSVLSGLGIERTVDGLGVTPSFGAGLAATYRLALYRDEQVVRVFDHLSGPAGTVVYGVDADPRIHIHSVAMALEGFDSTAGFMLSDGSAVQANRAVFLLEGAGFEGPPVSSVTAVVDGLSSFVLHSLALNLDGWTYRGVGDVVMTPNDTSVVVSNAGAGGNDGMLIDLDRARAWSMDLRAIDPTSSPTGAWLSVVTLGDSSGIEEPVLETWLEDRGTEWSVSFDFPVFASSTYTVEALLDGVVVDVRSLDSDDAARFQASGITLETTLGSPGDPEVTAALHFGSPVTVTLRGSTPTLADGLRAVPDLSSVSQGKGVPGSVQGFSAIRVTGTLASVEADIVRVDLEADPQGTFSGGATLEKRACRRQDSESLEYVFVLDNSLGSETICFEIEDEAPFLTDAVTGEPMPTFRRAGCAEAGTSCQVGFSGGHDDLPNRIVRNRAKVQQTRPAGTGDTVDTAHRSGPQPLGDIEPCLNSIQICDDDLIFVDAFEDGTLDAWDLAVGAI